MRPPVSPHFVTDQGETARELGPGFAADSPRAIPPLLYSGVVSNLELLELQSIPLRLCVFALNSFLKRLDEPTAHHHE